MTCGVWLDVPEEMRAAALDVVGGLWDEAPLPVSVTCELDKHDHGEHAARLRNLFEGAVWVMWAGDDITVRPLAYCESFRPSKGGISLSEALCWLPDAHRGGHTWERCA
ncbi:hypothetical protein QQM39_16055 [Streptomyces sp. DT2A-34]|uniref:hypothetical protein n=1 Tax=Streptomyces sp. DT2A-34 TaxID=3051182 RepID=UPI00265BBAF8|nr:hypothetical protein [Streptomyces sp. DT2A-34]MDO0912303.1 hypothetical protein [Streptomyces sp. DT2A-34]